MEALKKDERLSERIPYKVRDTILLPHKHKHRKVSGKHTTATSKPNSPTTLSDVSDDGENYIAYTTYYMNLNVKICHQALYTFSFAEVW